MKSSFLILFLSLLVISFLNIGGCGGGGDESDDTNAEDPGMEMGDMQDDEIPEQINFVSGGQLPTNPETFSYVENGTSRQRLDFYGIQGLPEAREGLRPAILFIHGGFWVSGSKSDVDPIVFEVAEEAGFHMISIGYRLADSPAPWPAIIQDVNTAIRWIKLNSDMLGVDPDALVISGPSAGGHLAALAATAGDVSELQGTENPGSNTDVIAAIAVFGVHNLNTVFSQEAVELFIDLNCDIEDAFAAAEVISLLIDDDCDDEFDPFNLLAGCDQDRLDLASPLIHVDSSDPPMFLAHGTDDCTVLFLQSEEMADALDNAGVFNQFILTEGGMHDLESLNITADDILDFLETALGIN